MEKDWKSILDGMDGQWVKDKLKMEHLYNNNKRRKLGQYLQRKYFPDKRTINLKSQSPKSEI